MPWSDFFVEIVNSATFLQILQQVSTDVHQ